MGVTLYCMILGQYPFLADTLQDTYDKVRVLGSDRQDFFLESQESSVKNPKPLRICLLTDCEQPFDNPGWIESSS